MNLDICSNCLRKPSFYRIIAIDDGYYILQGNTGCCLIAINQTEETEFLEDILCEHLSNNKSDKIQIEWLKNLDVEIQERCPFYVEHLIMKGNV